MPFQQPELRLASRAHTTVAAVGEEAAALLVIDDALEDPAAARAFALSLAFAPASNGYPGWRAPLTVEADVLGAFLARVGASDHGVARAYGYASMLAPRTEGLRPNHKIPHFDPAEVAAVLFLNPDEQCSGGTGFYRHRRAGAQRIHDLADVAGEVQRLKGRCGAEALGMNEFLGVSDRPDTPHIMDSNDTWELLRLVPMRFNRLIVYDGRLFHAPYCRDGIFGDELEQRRLTLNVFGKLPTGAAGLRFAPAGRADEEVVR